MNLRKRKKKPPDSLLSILDLPFASSHLVDLALASPNFRSPFPTFPFPCPLLDSALSSVLRFNQICSPPQPVDGVQSKICWSRSRSSPTTILGTSGLRSALVERRFPGWHIRSPVDGVQNRTYWSRSGLSPATILGTSGPGSAMVERCHQGWHIRSVSLECFCH